MCFTITTLCSGIIYPISKVMFFNTKCIVFIYTIIYLPGGAGTEMLCERELPLVYN